MTEMQKPKSTLYFRHIISPGAFSAGEIDLMPKSQGPSIFVCLWAVEQKANSRPHKI